MSKETIKFLDNIEISCSENTLIIQEKPLKNSEWILMHLVLIGSILLGITALCIALLLPFAEISLLSILLALMFLLSAIAPLNGIFFSSMFIFGYRAEITFKGDMPRYRFRSGLFYYSKILDGERNIVIAPVSSRGDWGFCAYITAKTFLKYLLPSVPCLTILSPRMVGSKRAARKEADEFSALLIPFNVSVEFHRNWQKCSCTKG